MANNRWWSIIVKRQQCQSGRDAWFFVYFALRDKMDALGSLEEQAVRIEI